MMRRTILGGVLTAACLVVDLSAASATTLVTSLVFAKQVLNCSLVNLGSKTLEATATIVDSSGAVHLSAPLIVESGTGTSIGSAPSFAGHFGFCKFEFKGGKGNVRASAESYASDGTATVEIPAQ